jgi:hypothetical protein
MVRVPRMSLWDRELVNFILGNPMPPDISAFVTASLPTMAAIGALGPPLTVAMLTAPENATLLQVLMWVVATDAARLNSAPPLGSAESAHAAARSDTICAEAVYAFVLARWRTQMHTIFSRPVFEAVSVFAMQQPAGAPLLHLLQRVHVADAACLAPSCP